MQVFRKPVYSTVVFKLCDSSQFGTVKSRLENEPRLTAFLQLFTVSTMNWQTFSELAFSFILTFKITYSALLFDLIMGFIGGVLPKFRAA